LTQKIAKFVELTLEKNKIPQFLCQKMAKFRQEIITLVLRSRGHLMTMKVAKLDFKKTLQAPLRQSPF
jgi:hypothetical protein